MRDSALLHILAWTIGLIKEAAFAARRRTAYGCRAQSFVSDPLDRWSIALAAMERAQSEKFMPAGFTAQSGQPEKTPKG
jgi:hypothetical protein